MIIENHGKEVLVDGKHFADACSPEASRAICVALRSVDATTGLSFLLHHLQPMQK